MKYHIEIQLFCCCCYEYWFQQKVRSFYSQNNLNVQHLLFKYVIVLAWVECTADIFVLPCKWKEIKHGREISCWDGGEIQHSLFNETKGLCVRGHGAHHQTAQGVLWGRDTAFVFLWQFLLDIPRRSHCELCSHRKGSSLAPDLRSELFGTTTKATLLGRIKGPMPLVFCLRHFTMCPLGYHVVSSASQCHSAKPVSNLSFS